MTCRQGLLLAGLFVVPLLLGSCGLIGLKGIEKPKYTVLEKQGAVLITADHGNDPTFTGNDHTREYVPVLLHGQGCAGQNLGIREGFFDLAQTVLHHLKLEPGPRGISMLS